ncbi:SURF1 family cytochrome oxidase biogenesis protein [Sphingomonas sp. PB4P5]|uniref:SURF1 family cytochrome oxidase biogenesis protein n=1 Tax=Parasphingomonas puruogangriensis TaxID=3096155 RepID=UPI002FCBADB6
MKRLPILSTIVVGLAIAVMVALGVWQLQRKAEKEAMMAQYAANITLPEIAFPAKPVDDALLFRKAAGFCREPISWSQRSGRDAKGATGWRQIAHCGTGVEAPGLIVQLGLSRQPGGKPAWRGGAVRGYISHAPDNQPLILALVGMAHPKTLMLVAATPVAALAANPVPDLSSVPNNHLAYAVQWFLFAGIAGIIYGLALRRRMTTPPAEVAPTSPAR